MSPNIVMIFVWVESEVPISFNSISNEATMIDGYLIVSFLAFLWLLLPGQVFLILTQIENHCWTPTLNNQLYSAIVLLSMEERVTK